MKFHLCFFLHSVSWATPRAYTRFFTDANVSFVPHQDQEWVRMNRDQFDSQTGNKNIPHRLNFRHKPRDLRASWKSQSSRLWQAKRCSCLSKELTSCTLLWRPTPSFKNLTSLTNDPSPPNDACEKVPKILSAPYCLCKQASKKSVVFISSDKCWRENYSETFFALLPWTCVWCRVLRWQW